jgi:uncharacterized protein (TIGR02246 family)
VAFVSTASSVEAVHGIRNVISAYAQAIDDGRTDDVVATFCPDATVNLPGLDVMRGHEAIRAAYAKMTPRRPQRHVVVNTIVTATGEESATATSDLLVLVKGESGWAVQLVGRYEDELRRDDGTWRFAARRLTFVE